MATRPGRLIATIGLTLALAACGGSPTASNGSSGPGADASKYEQYEALKGQDRRDKLLADAKAEGEVSVYTSMTSDVAEAVTKAFTDQTGVKVSLYRAASETVLQRILQESSARHAGADVVETDALEMAALGKEKLIAPYTGERRDLVGPEGQFENWTASRYNLFSPSWNTTKVPSGTQPTSWEALADPKFNGQLAMELSDYDWYLTLYGYWQQHGKSTAEIDQLFSDMANGAKVVKGHTVMGELLSAGQYSVAASNYTYLVQRAQDKGAPVAYQPLVQPVIARPQGAALMNSAAHPAAALLFEDWLLTEGQKVFVDLGLTPSIEPAGLKDPLEGLEVISVDVNKLLNEQKKWSDQYNALLEKSDKVG
ncbi:MAG: iron(III) transport system substrate-binding protein [Mycobacterium sp.]|jgi:iron(III) transport system substrate-binding protein|nr:iron(III) transport system substrate-binding protein [Mycobacterium sp.]